MDRQPDNNITMSYLLTPLFELDSEQLEFGDETNNSFNVNDCSLDEGYNQDENLKRDNDQKLDIITLRNKLSDKGQSTMVMNYTTSCITNNKGMVEDCKPLFGIPKRGKINLIKLDIDAIKRRLMSFLCFVPLSDNVQNKYEFCALIDIAKIKLSDLDIYWNNIYIVTKELNRQINELKNSNTVSCHMNQEIADLYAIYANTKQRLQSEKLRYQNASDTWDGGDNQLMELEMKFNGFSGNNIADKNQNSGCDSESVMSNSGSESRSEFYIDYDKSDSSESHFNTDIVNAETASEETIMETSLNNNARFRRMKWIAFIFYLIIIILWSVNWLEPQCCDTQNSYKWSFNLDLRYVNGPPPT